MSPILKSFFVLALMSTFLIFVSCDEKGQNVEIVKSSGKVLKPRLFGNIFNGSMTTGTTGLGGLESIFGNTDLGAAGTVGTLGTSAVLLKGGFLTVLSAIKAVVVPGVVLILLVVFLVAGIAFFTCSITDCSSAVSSLPGLDGLTSGFLNKNSYDYYEKFRPILSAFEEGQKKYGGNNNQMYNHYTSPSLTSRAIN